ncbi:RAD51-associated protein 1 isoform X3 [Varanus komodoensis]|uniref:RAD51-associated protein 1 isoform X3 n=1 Tax=Varanus komodoensis TaxID=61221 RepID=UPI001CF7CE5C|nr:RAD51-associated protein 1 isoform X3 [Varanus komodoensis]
MERQLRRNKTAVDYYGFDSAGNDEEDFADRTLLSNKKMKIMCSESTKEKMEQQQKVPQKEVHLQKCSQSKRVALEDRIYQRNLEIAFALSVDEPLGSIHEESQEQADVTEDDSSFSEKDYEEFLVKKKSKDNRKEGRKHVSTKKTTEKPFKSKRNVVGAAGYTNQVRRVPVKLPTQNLRLGLSSGEDRICTMLVKRRVTG